MEYLGLPAVEAIERLNSRNIKFKMNYTVPMRGYFKVDDSKLYIVRVKVLDDNVIFGGRLGEYRYYDMDKVIAAALKAVEKEKNN